MTWLAVWAVVMAVQGAVVSQVLGDPYAVAGAIALTQVLKLPISVPRLNDLGRPADDALWGMFPLLNVALFFQLIGGTPSDELRDRRVRSWSTQLSAAGAFRVAAGAMAASVSVVVPTILIATVAAGVVEGLVVGIERLMNAEDAQRVANGEMVLYALGAVVLYTLVQLSKMSKASRASWVPSLAVLPLMFVAGAIFAAPSLSTQAGLVIGGLPIMAADLMVWPLASGVLLGMWLRAGRGPLGEADDEAETGTWGDTAAVWGGRSQAVAVASQFLFIPGVFLSIIWAFADIITVIRPGQAAFKYSSRLARGVYNKLFKMLAIWFVVMVVLEILVMSPWVDVWSVLQTLIGVPGLVPPPARMAAAVVRVLASWWFALAVMAVFLERDGLFVALQERKAAEAAAATA